MYKTGNTGFVDVILNSESVEDLLANIGMVQKILESDQDLLEKLQKDHEVLKELKTALENQKAALEDQQIALEAQQMETEELKTKYQQEADEMHAMEMQMEAEAAEMAAQAQVMQLQAEAMIVESGGQIEVPAGEYAFPIASNWECTSNYGWRICPFHGREFHNGVDLVLTSGTYGAPVYAIADGYVTRASWYGGYGNCIQYACGGGISVLCGHLSGYNCSAGQFVKKGTVIGYIGSTGNSTGPHLHFTVFQNGDDFNPLSLY
jgi:murein DD-endopeptidase MepM/ murein hydrolase activator NlpD